MQGLTSNHRAPEASLESGTTAVVVTGLLGLAFWLSLGLIFDLTGYFPGYLRRLAIGLLLLLPLVLRPARRMGWAVLGLVGVIALQDLVSMTPVAEICLWLLAHQWVWGWVAPPPARLQAGILSYAFLHFYLFLSPSGFPVVESISRLTGAASGWLTGSSYHLGYTYQCLGGFLLFLCVSVFSWDRTRMSKGRTAGFLLVALLLGGLLAATLMRKVNFGADLVWKLKFREVFGYAQLWAKLKDLGVLWFPGLAFLAYLSVYVVLHDETWRKEREPGPPPAGRWSLKSITWLDRRWFGLGLLGVISLLLMLPPTAWRKPRTSRLVFVERGVVSYTRPDYTRFGRAAGGMFGLLPEYARLFGCEGQVVPDIPDTLEPDQIVVLTNLDEPLSPETHRRLWAFVAAGGRLWVLGDHTFIKHGRNHINDLLAPCHIALNHDSAQFFPQGWFHSYVFLPGTPFGALTDLAENRPAILVGASLDLRIPAVPFIVGRFGYSDWGTMAATNENQGYLGDFKYQPRERLGDLALVAGERYGRGKVLVFGDTTSFFCNNLSRSYELLRACLSWLGDPPATVACDGWGFRLATGLVLVLFVVAVGIFGTPRAITGVLLATGLASQVAHSATGQVPYRIPFARERLAVIDFSHVPFASKHSSMDSGLHGISINLMRFGLLPATINEWDSEVLAAAGVIVLNAPCRPFRASERRDLHQFMERGGRVVLGCGYPHFESSRSLLEPFGIRILGIPLGRFFDHPAFGRPISFMSAWPMEVENPSANVICVYDDWPLVVAVPVGQGWLVVISDSEFLHNRNLEGLENYDPANVQFVRSLLEYITARRAP